MTIKEYMEQRFASLGMAVSDADIMDMKLDDSESLTDDNKNVVYKAFVRFIPHMLLRPTSISEGGASISRAQKADIEAWYRVECKRLGMEDSLSPRVKFI